LCILAIAVAVGYERRKEFHLTLGLQHGLVCTAQIIKVRDERTDAGCHVEGLEHMAAYEVSQVAY